MSQVGQTTPSGGREFNIYPQQAVLRPITLPVGATLNHIGVWCREQTTVNANDLKGAIYTSAGVLVAQTSVLSAAISSTSTHALKQVNFAGQSVAAGNYIIAVGSGPATSGLVIVQGQNGPGGVPVSFFTSPAYYPNFPSDISTLWDTTATRSWDLYLDYTEASAATGSLAATESGADAFDAAGNVGSNGLRLTLRDTDTGALAANLTGLIVSVRSASNIGTVLLSSTSQTTNGSGVIQIASNAIGNVGDYVYLTVEKSDNSIVATYRVQVVDLNA